MCIWLWFSVFFSELGAKIFGGIFALVGVFLLLLNFATNFNSIKHYYQIGLLKKHGIEVLATISNKTQEDYLPKPDPDDDTLQTSADIERELMIEYDYIYQGEKYDKYSTLSKQAIFDGLAIGDKIPIMILPSKPNVHAPRMRKIENQVKRKGLPISGA